MKYAMDEHLQSVAKLSRYRFPLFTASLNFNCSSKRPAPLVSKLFEMKAGASPISSQSLPYQNKVLISFNKIKNSDLFQHSVHIPRSFIAQSLVNWNLFKLTEQSFQRIFHSIFTTLRAIHNYVKQVSLEEEKAK